MGFEQAWNAKVKDEKDEIQTDTSCIEILEPSSLPVSAVKDCVYLPSASCQKRMIVNKLTTLFNQHPSLH